MRSRYVVIGGGLSGASSAILLAQAGHQVTLVEQAPQLAPLLRGFRRRGTLFDTGFHYTGGLEQGGLLQRLFTRLGIAEELETYPLASEGYDIFRASDDGREFRFPVGRPALRQALCREFPDEVGAIDAYLQRVDAVYRALPELPRMQAAAGEFAELSLSETLDRLFVDPYLKQLLSLHTVLYGVAPQEAAFPFHASIAGLYYRSAHGIKGGGEALAELLLARLQQLQVEVLTGTAATALKLDSSRQLSGVEVSGGRLLPCDGAIVSIHPHQFLQLVPEEALRPIYRKRLLELEETTPALFLFGTSSRPLDLLQHTNLFVGRRWNGKEPFSLDSLCYLTGARGVGDERRRGVIAIAPVDPASFAPWQKSEFGARPAAYRQQKQELLEALAQRLRQSCPEIFNQIDWYEGGTPLTSRHYLGTPGGGLYGAKHMIGQFNPQARTRLGGVFLTGQSVTAPGLLGATMSAFLTCSEALGERELMEEVAVCR